MKKHRNRALAALCVCIAVLAWSAAEIHAVGGNLQYLIPAPVLETADTKQAGAQTDPVTASKTDSVPNAKAQALWKSLQTTAENWDGMMEAYTLSGIAEGVSFTGSTGEAKQARLNALGPNAFVLSPKYLRVGRLFYPEELANGSLGILLDEQLALALFRVAEPIGRTVTAADISFTVIGVLRHTKRVGDNGDYAAYVPLAALWNRPLQLNALQVTVKPVASAGAASAFAADMKNWQAGGTLINLGKEGLGALLPLRVLLFFIGSALFFTCLRYWNNRLRGFLADARHQLQADYAARLWPRFTLSTLVLLLGYGMLTLAAAALIRYLVAPVYTFPEWVPAVLVAWQDIRTAFWQVWQGAASLMELRSPELIRIRFFGMLTGWASAAAAGLLTYLWGLYRRGKTETASAARR